MSAATFRIAKMAPVFQNIITGYLTGDVTSYLNGLNR
jgi:hypothetical protein